MGNPKIAELGKDTQFKPGESGNPAGKPKGVEHSKTRLLKFLSLMVKAKNNLLTKEEEEELSVLELMDIALIAKATQGDVKAYKEIMDRLEGKPVETIKQKVEIDTDKKINISIDGKGVNLSE